MPDARRVARGRSVVPTAVAVVALAALALFALAVVHHQPPSAQPPRLVAVVAASNPVPPPVLSFQAVTKRYSSKAFVHLINNSTRFEGAVLIKHLNSPTFDFVVRRDLWTQLNDSCRMSPLSRDYREFELKGGCRWCAASTGACPYSGRFIANGGIIDDHHRPHAGAVDALNGRSFQKENLTYWSVRAVWETIWVACELDRSHDLALLATEDGYLTLPAIPALRLSTEAGETLRPRGENIVCGRGTLRSRIDPSAVVRWAEIYLEHWGFSRVVLYETGLSKATVHALLRPLIQSGRLIMVDQRDEAQRLYGHLASDALLVAYGEAQTLQKIDCLARAKSLGAKWTLHVDKDEILMPSLGKRFANGFDDLAAMHPRAHWLSFGTLNTNDSAPCQAAFSVQSYARQAEDLHAAERTASAFPFVQTTTHSGKVSDKDHWGRRKVAVRVDEVAPAVWGVGQHKHVVYSRFFFLLLRKTTG